MQIFSTSKLLYTSVGKFPVSYIFISKSLMALWLWRTFEGVHDLEVVGSSLCRFELVMHITSVWLILKTINNILWAVLFSFQAVS